MDGAYSRGKAENAAAQRDRTGPAAGAAAGAEPGVIIYGRAPASKKTRRRRTSE